jgi:hypothetical protein
MGCGLAGKRNLPPVIEHRRFKDQFCAFFPNHENINGVCTDDNRR